MQFVALVLMLAAAVAMFVPNADTWFIGLFGLAILFQIGAVYDRVQRWRKAAK